MTYTFLTCLQAWYSEPVRHAIKLCTLYIDTVIDTDAHWTEWRSKFFFLISLLNSNFSQCYFLCTHKYEKLASIRNYPSIAICSLALLAACFWTGILLFRDAQTKLLAHSAPKPAKGRRTSIPQCLDLSLIGIREENIWKNNYSPKHQTVSNQ